MAAENFVAGVSHLPKELTPAFIILAVKPQMMDQALADLKSVDCGAGALLEQSDEDAASLRINVTSPAGTTEAALKVLMAKDNGLAQLLQDTVRAAARRSRELAD